QLPEPRDHGVWIALRPSEADRFLEAQDDVIPADLQPVRCLPLQDPYSPSHVSKSQQARSGHLRTADRVAGPYGSRSPIPIDGVLGYEAHFPGGQWHLVL